MRTRDTHDRRMRRCLPRERGDAFCGYFEEPQCAELGFVPDLSLPEASRGEEVVIVVSILAVCALLFYAVFTS